MVALLGLKTRQLFAGALQCRGPKASACLAAAPQCLPLPQPPRSPLRCVCLAACVLQVAAAPGLAASGLPGADGPVAGPDRPTAQDGEPAGHTGRTAQDAQARLGRSALQHGRGRRPQRRNAGPRCSGGWRGHGCAGNLRSAAAQPVNRKGLGRAQRAGGGASEAAKGTGKWLGSYRIDGCWCCRTCVGCLPVAIGAVKLLKLLQCFLAGASSAVCHSHQLLCFPCLPQKVDRRPESAGSGSGTKRERCVGVETFWRQLEPAQRRQLLRVPLSKMVEGEGLAYRDFSLFNQRRALTSVSCRPIGDSY